MRHPREQTCTQRRLKLQKQELKREQCDEEEAESNHEEQIESCPGTLLQADPQGQETPREAERSSVHSLGGWKPSLVTRSNPEAKHDQRKIIKPT